MQTFVVHNRAPREFLRDIGWRGFLGFQVLVGGMILSSVLHTIFIGSLILKLAFEGVVGLQPRDIWDWAAVLILSTGYGGAFAIQVSGLMHQRAYYLLPIQILLPAYWVLHTLAAGRAALELINDPMHWAKTTHGVTRLTRGRATGLAGETAMLKPRIG